MANSQIAKVTSKGQVVIPKSVRDQMGIKEGTRLEFTNVNDNVVIKIVKEELSQTLDDLIEQALQIPPEDRPTLIDFGDELFIDDGWVSKPMDEYASPEEFLKEWNDFCAKQR